MARVSVLLTCYNHLKFLPQALDSVRAQSYRDFEVLAIDDGSTDGTREWLAQQKEIRTVFNVRNLGTYGALNEALEHTSGELVAILNDDDVWLPEKLEKQVQLLDSDPQGGIVHTGGKFIDGEGKETPGNPLGFRFPTFKTGDILLGLVYENKIIASAALVRRECFERLGGFDHDYFGSGDWQMWYRIAEAYWAGFVVEPLTLYRVHGANASHKLDRIWQDDQRLREWMLTREETLQSRFTPGEVRAAAAFNWAALGTVQTLNGDPAAGRRAYVESIKRSPLRLKSYLRWLATYLPREQFKRTL